MVIFVVASGCAPGPRPIGEPSAEVPSSPPMASSGAVLAPASAPAVAVSTPLSVASVGVSSSLPSSASSAPAPSASVAVGPSPGARAPLCFIQITRTLAADVFRGVPRSPSRDAARARLSRDTRDRWDGRDHALGYVRCRYALRLNGQPFTYDHVAKQGFPSLESLDASVCDTPTEKHDVEKRLVETTRQCTDPHAGAYWGFDLQAAEP